MTDTAQIGLKEPAQVDWENYGATSSFVAPPPAIGPDGKAIVYYGVATATEDNPDEGFLNFRLDPVKIVKSGNPRIDGYEIRFTRASARPFTKLDASTGERVPKKGNPNALADYLRACGSQTKPQTNDQYRACVKAVNGKPFPFVGDWEAYNKDTQERIRGFKNFPDDPDRPGQKKAILKKGDTYTVSDRQGNIIETKTVESDVLFANFKLRYFQDPSRGGSK